MHNLDTEKKIILILAFPLGLLSLFLLALGQGVFVGDAAQSGYPSETIYSERVCSDCQCADSGKKLISFKGSNANCEEYANEEERMRCYDKNSQMEFSCENLGSRELTQQCYAQHSGPNFDYYHGGAGTLVATQSFSVNGSRVYLNGFDCRGEHKITTGTSGAASGAITFREGSRDVEYGGNLDVYGNVNLLSGEAGVYFGSEIGYKYTDLGNGSKGQKLTTYSTENGINLNKCGDMKFVSGGNNLLTVPGQNRSSYGVIEIESGLEIDGTVKLRDLFISGQKLLWSEPIRGYYVLYATGSGGEPPTCELGDFER